MKYSSKRSVFFRYYAYLCHVIDDLLTSGCSTEVGTLSEKAIIDYAA